MLKIRPFDVFLFGDGREFNRGQQMFRQGAFFINPVPILGALNNAVSKKLNINFISLEKSGKLYFKMPLDIKSTKPKEEKVSYLLAKLEKNSCITSQSMEYIVSFNTNEKIQDINLYVSQDIFKDYLLGKINLPEKLKEIDSIKMYPELRTGIEIDHTTRTTVEGMLFFQMFTRLEEGAGFFVKTDLQDNINWLKVGGEGRGFKVERSADLTTYFDGIKSQIKQKIKETGAFKIILLTPSNAIPEVEGAQPIARITGKPITYSGWLSLMKRKGFCVVPTRIFRLIPEGSVFYYKLTDISKADEIVEKFWFKPSFYTKEFPYFDTKRPAGFGITAITYTQI